MQPGFSIIQRTIVATAMPMVATLMGLQVGCTQPQVTLSIQGEPTLPPPFEDVSILITVGPPPIPEYEQPACPDNNYLWAPGYWAMAEDGYFWVPGTWVMAPAIGLLWTPGYWGWSGRTYAFHEGHWGSHVGFYGGINYGYGYGGSGFDGGRWQGENYSYNRSVTSVNVTHITNVYYEKVIINNNTHVAYNGGAGGVKTAPTRREQTADRERRMPETEVQNQHHQSASQAKEFLASANKGKPPVAATMRPADFSPDNIRPAKAVGGRVEPAALVAKPRSSKPPVSETGLATPDPHPEPVASAPVPAPQERPTNEAASHQLQLPMEAPTEQLTPRNPSPSMPPPSERPNQVPVPLVRSKVVPPRVHKTIEEPANQTTPGNRPAPVARTAEKPSQQPMPPSHGQAAPNQASKNSNAPVRKPTLKRGPAPAPADSSAPSNPKLPYLWPPPREK